MGICACQAKKPMEPGVKAQPPLRIETQEVHVRERGRHDSPAPEDAEGLVNLPSAKPTYQQSGGSQGAGSGGRDSRDGSGGQPFTDGSSYKVGQPIYQKSKVKVYQCMQSSGKFVTMKYVYVNLYHQLSEEDMKPENINLCNEIVALIKAKLFPLDHPYLVKYVHCHFDLKKRSKLDSSGLEIGTEYMPESLLQIRVNFGPFDMNAIRKYLKQVLYALEYLHTKDIEA